MNKENMDKLLRNVNELEIRDPVHQDDDKWYFYDETWTDRYGPYDTEEIARTKLAQYVDSFLGE